MLIENSNLALSSTHELEQTTLRELRLAEPPRAGESFAKLLDDRMRAVPASLLEIDTPAAASASSQSPFQAIVEMLLGLAPPPGMQGFSGFAGGGGMDLQAVQLVHTKESESCTFAAHGSICLADGSTRQFDVGYAMERSEESDSLSAVSFHDPLMLDFAQPSTGLSGPNVDFDLDGDGRAERMRMPGATTAVLFDDRNGNGMADDGSELFGPGSGDGFADLAKLDVDHNGWIDEGDPAFRELKLWQLDADGASKVQTLAEAGVGALATQSAATPFTLKQDGATVGQVHASSVWLGETGGAGIVRQVDVAVTPSEAPAA